MSTAKTGLSRRDMDRGRRIAEFLAGAWRAAPGPVSLSPSELADITPFLLQTGAGALAWWRIRHTQLEKTAAARQLRKAYRLHAVQSAVHEANLQQIFDHLGSYSDEVVLFKGWVVSRYYADPALRPFGDIDLAVPPGQLTAIHKLLRASTEHGAMIDLHEGMPDLPDRQWSALWARCQCVRLGNARIQILSPEDQLRNLCLHLLRHGAWRPLWLCDVAAIVESLNSQFDWDYCLSGNRRLSEWVLSVLGLASHLLGAQVKSVRALDSARLPPWLVDTLLERWGAGDRGDSHNRDDRPILESVRNFSRFWHALRCRWPNAIEAALKLRSGPFSPIPRCLLQLAAFLQRAFKLFIRLPKHCRRDFAESSVTIHS